MDASVYILNKTDSQFLRVNETNARILRVASPKDLMGNNVKKFIDPVNAESVLQNDKYVISMEKFLAIEERAIVLPDDKNVHCISLKMPCYKPDASLLGIFGISVVLSGNNLTPTFKEIDSLKLFNMLSPAEVTSSFKLPKIFDHLSPREKQVLEFVVKGLSAKRIANKLLLSSRTVEHHIQNIKHSLKLKTKLDLIELYHSSV